MDLLAKRRVIKTFCKEFQDFKFVLATGVSLFALVSHLNCTAFQYSQSELSDIFMYVVYYTAKERQDISFMN